MISKLKFSSITVMALFASFANALEPGKEVVLMGIPLFHVYGMVAGMNFAMANGASMVMVPNARDLKDVLENISKYKATIFPGI